MGLQFGIFDHIEPVPGLALEQIYRIAVRGAATESRLPVPAEVRARSHVTPPGESSRKTLA
jgi:hypothetical protein